MNLIINLIIFLMITIILSLFSHYYLLITFFNFFFNFREVIIKMSLLRLITLNKTSLLKSDRFKLIINFDMINFV